MNITYSHSCHGTAEQAKLHPSKETAKRLEKAIQKLTDDFVAKIDAAAQAKETEVLSV